MKEINWVILDVDGVVVGDKKGYNTPLPSEKTISAIKAASNEGVKFTLCSGKWHYAIDPIALKAQLDGIHVTDGGGVLINPVKGEVVRAAELPSASVKAIAGALLEEGVYAEVYSVEKVFVQASQVCDFTKVREHIVMVKPTIVESLAQAVEGEEIIKVLSLPQGSEEKNKVKEVFGKFGKGLELHWASSLMMPGREAGFFTLEGVSKASSIKFIAEKQGLKLENALGVGDHESDWGFMQLCGEVATLENGSKGIKEKVRERKGFVAPSVNDEGFAEILRHYLF